MPFEKTLTVVVKSPYEEKSINVTEVKLEPEKVEVDVNKIGRAHYYIYLSDSVPAYNVIEEIDGHGRPGNDATLLTWIITEILKLRMSVSDPDVFSVESYEVAWYGGRNAIVVVIEVKGKSPGTAYLRIWLENTGFTVKYRRT